MKNYLWALCGLLLLASCEDKPEETVLEQNVRTQLDDQNWKEALNEAEELVKYYPENADGHNMKGYALLQMGELARADTSFSKAIALDTTNYKYFFNLGNTYNKIAVNSGEPRDILQAHFFYGKAIERQPNLPQLYINRAVMINNLQGFLEAVNDLKFAISLDDVNPISHYLLGRTYRNLANKDTIWIDVERVGFTPEEKQAYRDSALTHLEKAVELNPTFSDALQWLGMTQMENGNSETACEMWKRAKAEGSEEADTNLHLNCAGFSDEHSQAEVDSMVAAVQEELEKMEEGHFLGDGHDH